MPARLIRWSIENRLLVVIATLIHPTYARQMIGRMFGRGSKYSMRARHMKKR